MILCVGEILADMIGAENGGSYFYERKAGGAPFNVACGIQKFGGRATFAGSVGDDLIGEFLINFAKNRNLDGLIIEKRKTENTTLAFVQLDKSGERSFCFYRKNTADYRLPEITDETLQKADLVYVGSLMISENCGYDFAVDLANRARKLNKPVCFDVNFRTDIFRDEAVAKERYIKLLELSDIIKLSEDEVEIFGEEYLNDRLREKLLCISLGEKGSEWRYNGKRGRVGSIHVKPVDTTGAGDAFFAGVLKGLDGTKRTDWTADFLNGVFAEANVCGALNTLGKGAIDCLPDRAVIEAELKKIQQ